MSINLEIVVDMISPNKFWVCRSDSHKSCILFSKIEGFPFWIGKTEKDEYESWNGESNRFWDCRSDSRKSSILVSKTDNWSFWRVGTEYDSWKYYGIGKANISWNFRSASCMASILFFNSDFSSMGCCRKGIYEAWCEKVCVLSLFCWDSSMVRTTFILFSYSDFSLMSYSRKEV